MDKVICLGKNYPAHAAELGDKQPDKPVIFIKPPSVMKQAYPGRELLASMPTGRGSVHHECEIVLRITGGGYRLSRKEAEGLISAVTLGLDMTLRDEQNTLKRDGHPWTIAKVFPDSILLGPWRRMSEFPEYLEVPFSLSVNGNVRQKAIGDHMFMKPSEAVSYVSHFFPLCDGDIVFTGTPVGVQPVVAGDRAVLDWGGDLFSIRWNHHEPGQTSRSVEGHPA